MRWLISLALVILAGCEREKEANPTRVRKDFIKDVLEGNLEEGPFDMSYSMRTVLFSDNVISLFGKTRVYTHLPHSWARYEGKTYCKANGKHREISLTDLFTTENQKEFLRNYCENNLKQQECSYFSGDKPLRSHLDPKDILTFVVDESSLILIFQPYSVGSYADGPFSVSIPYKELANQWNPKNPLATHLPITTFVSSWNKEAPDFSSFSEGL